MDITTILSGLPGPGASDAGASDAPVDGDLAALFAALLETAAGDVPVAVTLSAADAATGEATGAEPDGPPTGAATVDQGPVVGGGGGVSTAWRSMLGGGERPDATPTVPMGTGAASAGTVQPAAVGAPPEAVAPGEHLVVPDLTGHAGADAEAAPRPSGAIPGTPAGQPLQDRIAAMTGDRLLDGAATTDDLPTADATTQEAGGPRQPPRPVPVGLATAPGEGAVPASDVAGSRTAPPGAATPSTEPSVLDRIMEAVDSLENAPPPRRIRVEIGDLRVAVSLRHDGVHVAVDGDALPTPTWDEDLTSALEARGLTLADSGEKEDDSRHQRPAPQYEAPADSSAPTPAAASRQGDDALRL